MKKHAAEMLIYADPIRYEERVRSIHVSNRPKEAKAYLQNMYRHDGENRFKFACQLCHDTCSTFEATEIFPNPETELDPVNLCLCLNCATAYRKLRGNERIMKSVRNAFLEKNQSDIDNDDHIAVAIGAEGELWFTQTHFAEIRELLRLMDETKSSKANVAAQANSDEEDVKSGMSVYSGYIGKTIRRKDGFIGKVTDISINGEDTYLHVHVTGGKDVGKDTRITFSFLLSHRDVYTFSED